MSTVMKNFGRNVTLRPRRVVTPDNEAEVLRVLRECQESAEQVRAVGSLHSWSRIVEVPDVLVDVGKLRDTAIHAREGETVVEVGAGCSLQEVLDTLERQNLTLPTLGAIKKQLLPGAVASATHGSGAASLSHYVRAMRIACVNPETGAPDILTFDDQTRAADFDAARVSLGYLGIVTSVTLVCVPQYDVEEVLVLADSLRDDVLAESDRYPLQQFALIPYAWCYYAFRRRVHRSPSSLTLRERFVARIYRGYKIVVVDVLLHGLVKLMALLSSGGLIKRFFGKWFPKIALKNKRIIDRSDRALTLWHDLYRHVEMEVFVPVRHIEAALELVRHLTTVFARGGPSPDALPEDVRQTLAELPGMMESLRAKRGSFTYHYVINCRLVQPETALIAMSAGDEAYYSVSFFTFRTAGNESYYDYCQIMADCLVTLYGARLHWAKYFPLRYREGARRMYPQDRLAAFRDACRRYDPHGMFRNAYATEILGFED